MKAGFNCLINAGKRQPSGCLNAMKTTPIATDRYQLTAICKADPRPVNPRLRGAPRLVGEISVDLRLDSASAGFQAAYWCEQFALARLFSQACGRELADPVVGVPLPRAQICSPTTEMNTRHTRCTP